MKILLLILTGITSTSIVTAQNAPGKPKFEVASVKRSDQCEFITSIDPASVVLKGIPLKPVLREAFKVELDQIEGPSWLDTDCFEVVAKIPAGATRDQVPAMLQQLLAERFKLATHKEERQRSAYALVVDKGGPKLQEDDPKKDFMGFGKPGILKIGKPGIGSVKGALTMAKFATFLSKEGYGRVEDATGLKGTYDIELHWTSAAAGPPNDPTAAPPDAAIPAPEPSLFTALRETLGLKMERRNTAIPFLIIDHIERFPTPN